MICTVSHRASTERGFRYFEAGQDYDPSEVEDRGKYFEKAEKPPDAVEEKPPKKAKKITEEVTDNAG
jgi:hypothetical protein